MGLFLRIARSMRVALLATDCSYALRGYRLAMRCAAPSVRHTIGFQTGHGSAVAEVQLISVFARMSILVPGPLLTDDSERSGSYPIKPVAVVVLSGRSADLQTTVGRSAVFAGTTGHASQHS